jgi:hypothetical protein
VLVEPEHTTQSMVMLVQLQYLMLLHLQVVVVVLVQVAHKIEMAEVVAVQTAIHHQ